MKKEPILSICIPTYSRAEILRGSLSAIQSQLKDVDEKELELIVSNNCSPDNTEDVVRSFLKDGMPILYNCNNENIGSDGNFLKCMAMASGKYIWLIGDDDYLRDGSLKYILDCLRGKEYGLVYIDFLHPSNTEILEYPEHNGFVRRVGRQWTFMSVNIFRKDIVVKIDAEKYINTCLLQVPYYIISSMSQSTNAVINRAMLKIDVGNTPSPQKYNFLEVFSHNYNNIIADLLGSYSDIHKNTIAYVRKDEMNFIRTYIWHNLVRPFLHAPWRHDERWKFVWPYYGKEWYFYWIMFKCALGQIRRDIKSIGSKH